jgi:hypothetical protein
MKKKSEGVLKILKIACSKKLPYEKRYYKRLHQKNILEFLKHFSSRSIHNLLFSLFFSLPKKKKHTVLAHPFLYNLDDVILTYMNTSKQCIIKIKRI